MPRINVEDKWWSDPRRGRLIAKIGSQVLADGIMLNLWRVSQEFNGKAFDWTPYFEAEHIEAVSSIGLASLEHQLLYVKGSKEHHEWVKKKREAARAGGLKSAKLREAPLEHQSSISQPSSSTSYIDTSSSPKKGTKVVKEKKPWEVRILEQGEVKDHCTRLQESLESIRNPVHHGVMTLYLRTFTSKEEAEADIERIFYASQTASPNDIDGQVRFINACIGKHLKQMEAAYGDGT